jgi:hypothetical protein
MMRWGIATTAVVLLLAGCDGSGGDPEPEPSAAPSSDTSGSASGSPTVDPGPIATCPDARLLDPDPALPDAVPEGATSVRLCDGGADKVAPPVDALTTDVGTVVSAVNDQPLVERGCVDRRIPEYNLAFGYPDGSRFVVAGRFTRCAELLVGSARRAKAAPPLRTFVEGLRTQRSAATPPAQTVTPADLDCGRPPSNLPSPVALPTDLAVAVVCFGRPEQPGQANRVEIPSDDLTTLVASMRTDTASSEGYLGCGAVVRNEYWMVGASAWGDPIVMRRGCFALTVEDDLEWIPRGQAHSIIRRLVAEAR